MKWDYKDQKGRFISRDEAEEVFKDTRWAVRDVDKRGVEEIRDQEEEITEEMIRSRLEWGIDEWLGPRGH